MVLIRRFPCFRRTPVVALVLVGLAPGFAQASAAGLVPVSWTDTAAAVPGEAAGVYDTVADHVRPVLSWSASELSRVPEFYEEGKGLVMNGINRLRDLPLPTGPDYAGARRL